MSTPPNIARWAERYCEIGLALTWTPFGQKGPRHHGWILPENAITDPKRAFGYWNVNPEHGIAALLGPSGLVSLDVDDEQHSPRVLRHFGIDLEQLRESTPTIVGRHFRLMFKAPAGVPNETPAENRIRECSACGALGSAGCDCGAALILPALERAKTALLANPDLSNRAIAEKAQVSEPTARRARASNDAPEFVAELPALEKRTGRDGKQYTASPKVESATGTALKHRSAMWPKQGAPGNFCLFELRAGNLADTLPPSRHAVTGHSYCWENPPRNGFPPLPTRLLEIWQNWETTNREIRSLCPWWTPPPDLPAPRRTERKDRGESVIDAFNAAHNTSAILESHGYKKRDKRFVSPDSSHAAGIVLLDSGKVFCHHAGDPLHGEHALDAFDVFRLLDHSGDYRAAVRAAAQALGLDRERAA